MKYSKDKIEFLDTLIYKDKNNNIQAALYKKTYRPPKLYTLKIKPPFFTEK